MKHMDPSSHRVTMATLWLAGTSEDLVVILGEGTGWWNPGGTDSGGNKSVSFLFVSVRVVAHSCRDAVTAGGQYTRLWHEVSSREYEDDSRKSHPRLCDPM